MIPVIVVVAKNSKSVVGYKDTLLWLCYKTVVHGFGKSTDNENKVFLFNNKI
jgi:hypothetical protein